MTTGAQGVTSFAAPVVAWRGSTDESSPVVVLLHGRGATEESMAALVPHLPDGPAYAAVRAPLAEGSGFAWFANRGIGRPRAESLAETIAWFRDWLDREIDPGRTVILAGYSGGTAFAGGVLLSDPSRFSGAALLYGTLPFDAGVPVTAARLVGIPVLLALGAFDDVIPPELQEKTWEYLHRDSGAAVLARRESTGHELTASTVSLLAQWITSRIAFMSRTPSGHVSEVAWPSLPGNLPTRRGERPLVTFAMPQQQDSQNAPAELQEALFARISALPGITTAPSAISVPGARAFTLRDATRAPRLDAFIVPEVGEFAHLHPSYDGSLHLTLPLPLAHEAIRSGWATPHSLAGLQLSEGMVMVYGPRDKEELEVVASIVTASYEFARGS